MSETALQPPPVIPALFFLPKCRNGFEDISKKGADQHEEVEPEVTFPALPELHWQYTRWRRFAAGAAKQQKTSWKRRRDNFSLLFVWGGNVEMEIKAELERDRSLENGGRVQIYKVGQYRVVIRGGKDSQFVSIEHDRSGYLPSLHVVDDMEGGFRSVDVLVGTTSYGSLSPVEIRRFMDDMQHGIDAARYISETFILPMKNGTWNWNAI